jgi:DNA-binding response OmpR family regulator
MKNILVIEDDQIMLKAIKNILSKDGFNVVVAKDGKEAYEKMQDTLYDLVITDLMMPYANGLEIVSRLRQDETKKHVGIIIVSSVGNEDTITEAFRLGADDYLKKPIMAGELLIRIRRLLEDKAKAANPPAPEKTKVRKKSE